MFAEWLLVVLLLAGAAFLFFVKSFGKAIRVSWPQAAGKSSCRGRWIPENNCLFLTLAAPMSMPAPLPAALAIRISTTPGINRSIAP
jgi:hypothetical protein